MPQTTVEELTDLARILAVSVVVFLVLGVIAARWARRRPGLRRRVYTPLPEALHFSGRGEDRVEAHELIEGTYRIDYQFPAGPPIKVELIEGTTGSSEAILIRSGSGTDAFVVQRAGRHILVIEPLDADAAWTFSIRPIGPKPYR
jgi:hypothetical protein